MGHHTDQHRLLRLLALIAVAVGVAGCEFIAGYLGASPEEQLTEAALETFAAPGAPFVEARFSQDTVATVTAVGEGSWEVTIPDAGRDVWVFEVTRAEVLPVFPRDDFVQWLETSARGLGLRSFLPADAKSMVTTGSVLAVGDLEVAYGRSDREGRTELERVALLRPSADGDFWTVEGEGNRSARVLRDALRLVYGDMIVRDERVQTCMGSVDPRSVPRAVQLQCVAEALDTEYGEG